MVVSDLVVLYAVTEQKRSLKSVEHFLFNNARRNGVFFEKYLLDVSIDYFRFQQNYYEVPTFPEFWSEDRKTRALLRRIPKLVVKGLRGNFLNIHERPREFWNLYDLKWFFFFGSYLSQRNFIGNGVDFSCIFRHLPDLFGSLSLDKLSREDSVYISNIKHKPGFLCMYQGSTRYYTPETYLRVSPRVIMRIGQGVLRKVRPGIRNRMPAKEYYSLVKKFSVGVLSKVFKDRLYFFFKSLSHYLLISLFRYRYCADILDGRYMVQQKVHGNLFFMNLVLIFRLNLYFSRFNGSFLDQKYEHFATSILVSLVKLYYLSAIKLHRLVSCRTLEWGNFYREVMYCRIVGVLSSSLRMSYPLLYLLKHIVLRLLGRPVCFSVNEHVYSNKLEYVAGYKKIKRVFSMFSEQKTTKMYKALTKRYPEVSGDSYFSARVNLVNKKSSEGVVAYQELLVGNYKCVGRSILNEYVVSSVQKLYALLCMRCYYIFKRKVLFSKILYNQLYFSIYLRGCNENVIMGKFVNNFYRYKSRFYCFNDSVFSLKLMGGVQFYRQAYLRFVLLYLSKELGLHSWRNLDFRCIFDRYLVFYISQQVGPLSVGFSKIFLDQGLCYYLEFVNWFGYKAYCYPKVVSGILSDKYIEDRHSLFGLRLRLYYRKKYRRRRFFHKKGKKVRGVGNLSTGNF